jgi:hypothetical protein
MAKKRSKSEHGVMAKIIARGNGIDGGIEKSAWRKKMKNIGNARHGGGNANNGNGGEKKNSVGESRISSHGARMRNQKRFGIGERKMAASASAILRAAAIFF